MPIITVSGTVLDPSGSAFASATIEFLLSGTYTTIDGKVISPAVKSYSLAAITGSFTAYLESTTDGVPADLYYSATVKSVVGGSTYSYRLGYFKLPNTPNSANLYILLNNELTTITPGYTGDPVPSYTLSSLPAATTAGDLARLSNGNRGLVMASGAEWVNVNNNTFDVTAFHGDPTGAADSTTAILNAISAAHVAGGGRIVFPGTFLCNSQLAVPWNNIFMDGLGYGGLKLAAASSLTDSGNWSWVLVTGDDFSMRGMTIDCNGANQTHVFNGVQVGAMSSAAAFSAARANISDCVFKNGYGSALVIGKCKDAITNNNRFYDMNGASGNPGEAQVWTWSVNSKAQGNTVDKLVGVPSGAFTFSVWDVAWYIKGASYLTLVDNTVKDARNAVANLYNDIDHLTIVENTVYNSNNPSAPPISDYSDSNTNYLVKDNNGITDSDLTWTTLTNNSATPNVAGGKRFVAANSNPTTITNFLGGVEGQEITITFTNGNTTIDRTNAYLMEVGGSGANFTGAAYNTITLVRKSGVWLEVSRSVNL